MFYFVRRHVRARADGVNIATDGRFLISCTAVRNEPNANKGSRR